MEAGRSIPGIGAVVNLNKDVVPKNLEEAVNLLFHGLNVQELEWLATAKDPDVQMHHAYGRWLRNNWSLWVKETPIVLWFRENLKLGHADDISGIILEALVAKVMDIPYDAVNRAKTFHEHWKKCGCNEFGEKV